jgi:glycosyltransferase involved in cell wall biosynthesis
VDDVVWWKRWIAWLYDQSIGRLIFSICDKVVSINKANISFISKFCDKKKIEVIYNGIEFPEVKIEKQSKRLPSLAFVGRLAIGK